MSSDPFAELAGSLTSFSEAVTSAMNEGFWLDGSLAQVECDPEQYAGNWASEPCRAAWATTRDAISSGLDHLNALAYLLPADGVVLPLSTVSRGALEAFALAYYLSEPALGQRERVRRWANVRLLSAHDTTLVLDRPSDSNFFKQEKDVHAGMVERLVSTAKGHGFEVQDEKSRRSATHLEGKHPSATKLCDAVVSDTSGLGATYFSMLSSVAHSRMSALTSHILPLADVADDGTGEISRGQIGISSSSAAIQLMAAPLAAVVATTQVLPQQGFQVPEDEVENMLFIWARIAGVPHPADASGEI